MKAVIPAAGLGTRFLPATKAQPKEMLPIVDKPAIQYAVEEIVASGINNILIITGKGKRSIEDHFDRSPDLEGRLNAETERLLEGLNTILMMANICYVRQREPAGLGDAVRYASSYVGNEPFAIILADDIILAHVPAVKQLLHIYEQLDAPVIGVEPLPAPLLSKYGVIKGKKMQKGTYLIEDIVEKPAPEEAPSNMAVVGRYILTPDIFHYLKRIERGVGGEVQLTDAIRQMCNEREVYAQVIDGRRFDIGSKLNWVKVNIELALHRDEMRAELINFIQKLLSEQKL